jgi:uncharacterized membrane protein YfcA
MSTLLILMVLRPLVERLVRLVAGVVAASAALAAGDWLLRRHLDADLPREVTLALLILLAVAWLFLRASWRRRRRRILSRRRRLRGRSTFWA